MTGLFLLAVVGLWVWIAFKLSRRISAFARLGSGKGRLLVFVALMLLPLTDEIVGGTQFRVLCFNNASEFRLGVADPEGRTTRVTIDPSNEWLRGTAIPIRHSRYYYHDVNTGELVVEFDRYVAKGGLFIRALGISENDSPLTIGRPACSPQSSRAEGVHRTLRFNVVK